MTGPKTYDHWLNDKDATVPAALVIREYLMPVEGKDGVVFPPTFAAEQGNADDRFRGGYNIDGFAQSDNVCIIDTVGAQSNRVEPVFVREPYAALVPQVVIKAGGEKELRLLVEASHRAADAAVRCSTLQNELDAAFRSVLRGDASLLAALAPTSLVFGVWDSRGTGAKLPRVVASSIRAFNVRRLTRHAQYIPAINYVEEGLLPEPEGEDNYAERGFKHQPIGRQPDPKKPDPTNGGVIATGGIRRDATLSLAALRLLSAGKEDAKTLALRRYILGLALVAFTHPSAFVGYLRQGCNLVLDPDAKPAQREFVEVYPDGRRVPVKLTHDAAIEYAKATADAFGVGKSRTVDFDKNLAKEDVQGDDAGGRAKAPKGKGKK